VLIRVREDQSLALEEEENFKGFCIRVNNLDTDISVLDAITNRIEDSNYWLDAQGVIALSSKSTDKEWLDQFWGMLKGAEPYGFADLEAQLIRAHIEYDVAN
jgi:hypothetical protein|tara:strand:+ start:4282 stop:4587 length:306 start_codon:yes stop_codon:yes gene_type:complete